MFLPISSRKQAVGLTQAANTDRHLNREYGGPVVQANPYTPDHLKH